MKTINIALKLTPDENLMFLNMSLESGASTDELVNAIVKLYLEGGNPVLTDKKTAKLIRLAETVLKAVEAYKGVRTGRPLLSSDQKQEVRELARRGMKQIDIARQLNVSKDVVYRALKS